MPVDVVTGDRDLFQLVDDSRDVRVDLHGARHEQARDRHRRHRRREVRRAPQQYADFAILRGDASDGLPGVAGVGEKTAAALLAAHGDLDGILAAAEAGDGMSAGVRAKLLAGLPVPRRRPEVVAVVRDLDLPASTRACGPLDETAKADAAALADRWALGTAMTRIVDALDAI